MELRGDSRRLDLLQRPVMDLFPHQGRDQGRPADSGSNAATLQREQQRVEVMDDETDADQQLQL